MKSEQQESRIRLTPAQRKVIADLLPRLSGQLLLNMPNTRTIALPLDDVQEIAKAARGNVTHAPNGTIRNSLRHIIDAATKAIDNSQGIGAIPAAERLYQSKITLKESKPPIWRRIQVKNCTLDKLHEHIQTAMGWTNSHLHQFEIDGDRYGDPELLDDGFEDFECFDSTVKKISEIVPKNGKRFQFLYEYDFGDGWDHEVLFEGCLRAEKGQRYPICLEGERACPPEDIGGVWGYAEYLEALADPKHERHKDFMEWSGPFDPDEFDPKLATRDMKEGLPNWREMDEL